MSLFTSITVLLLATTAVAQQSAYGQCGGIGWSGATTCVTGYYCHASGDYYSQCIPGTAPAGGSTTQTTATTAIAATTTASSSSATTTVSSGSSATGPGTSLQSNYLWIRAVEAPNFHKYLQTNPEYTPGLAIMDSYTTAGQFNIVSGQLVELIGGGALLYANVEQNTTAAVKLAVTFSTTKNTFGTFDFSGDAVQWSTPGISRPNLSAWLVCANQQLFINLGSYGYMTPTGCADETIHYYNGQTAVS